MTEADEFRKYEIGGAYHWKWYLADYLGYRAFVRAIMAALPASGRLLDIGCGDGLMSFAAFRRGLSVSGIDNNDLAIGLARIVCADALAGKFDAAFRSVGDAVPSPEAKAGTGAYASNGDLAFACRSAFDLDEDGTYDCAICVEVIEHVAEPAALLAKIHRAIRNFAIITTPDGTGETPGPYDHQLWTPDSFGDFLGGYRFERLDLRPGTIAVKLFKE